MNDISDLFKLKGCKICGFQQLSDKGRDFILIKQEVVIENAPECSRSNRPMRKHDKREFTVIAPPVQATPCKFSIKYTRYRCPACREMWSPTFEDIDTKRRATKVAIFDIVDKCLRNTFKDVENDYMLTEMTARNIFCDFLKENKEKLRFKTPVFLGIDEIRIRNRNEITVITDLEKHTLYDILPKRDQKSLIDYFSQIPGRDNILWVCSDMYKPFEKAIGQALPNAKWVIDHFHLVARANLAVDSVRITIQKSLPKDESKKIKKELAKTLTTRYNRLPTVGAEKIRIIRGDPKLEPIAIAYDLKEDFYNIYDNNQGSIDNAKASFDSWERSIPKDDIYNKFRELANTVHNFYEQIFNFWVCPSAITNSFTECSNRIIKENNNRGRGYSFEILRAKALYQKTNLQKALAGGAEIGPSVHLLQDEDV